MYFLYGRNIIMNAYLLRSHMNKMRQDDLGYIILIMLQDPFIEKLYTPNIFVTNELSKSAWSNDLFDKYGYSN